MWAGVVFVLLTGVPTCRGAEYPAYEYYEADKEEDVDLYDNYSDDIHRKPSTTTTTAGAHTRNKRYDDSDVIKTVAPKDKYNVKGALNKILYGDKLGSWLTHPNHQDYVDIDDHDDKTNSPDTKNDKKDQFRSKVQKWSPSELGQVTSSGSGKRWSPVIGSQKWSPVRDSHGTLATRPYNKVEVKEELFPDGALPRDGTTTVEDHRSTESTIIIQRWKATANYDDQTLSITISEHTEVGLPVTEEDIEGLSRNWNNTRSPAHLRQKVTLTTSSTTTESGSTKPTVITLRPTTPHDFDDDDDEDENIGPPPTQPPAQTYTSENISSPSTPTPTPTSTSTPTITRTTTTVTTTTREPVNTTSTTPGSTTTGTTVTTTTPTVTVPQTTTKSPVMDINAIIAIIANLTYDYDWNLTEQFNKTLIDHGVPTCPTPSTPTTTTTTPPQYDFANTSVVGKCFVCGLKTVQIPRNAFCADAFAGDFLPLVPVDPRARGKIASFRKYCRHLDVHNYVENPLEPRSIYGRFTGGCGVRWTDLSGVYTQRTCRSKFRPLTGKHFGSKRMAKLELALINVENGCIISPMATLLPLSRGVSLYARFHACVCTGSWCNRAVRVRQTTLAIALRALIMLLVCYINYIR